MSIKRKLRRCAGDNKIEEKRAEFINAVKKVFEDNEFLFINEFFWQDSAYLDNDPADLMVGVADVQALMDLGDADFTTAVKKAYDKGANNAEIAVAASNVPGLGATVVAREEIDELIANINDGFDEMAEELN